MAIIIIVLASAVNGLCTCMALSSHTHTHIYIYFQSLSLYLHFEFCASDLWFVLCQTELERNTPYDTRVFALIFVWGNTSNNIDWLVCSFVHTKNWNWTSLGFPCSFYFLHSFALFSITFTHTFLLPSFLFSLCVCLSVSQSFHHSLTLLFLRYCWACSDFVCIPYI